MTYVLQWWQKSHSAVTWDMNTDRPCVPSYSRMKFLPPVYSIIILRLVFFSRFFRQVITEVGMVPCTSVPVVLRVKHALIKWKHRRGILFLFFVFASKLETETRTKDEQDLPYVRNEWKEKLYKEKEEKKWRNKHGADIGEEKKGHRGGNQEKSFLFFLLAIKKTMTGSSRHVESLFACTRELYP